MEEFDLYKTKNRLESAIKKIKEASIQKKNKDLILEFIDHAMQKD